MKLKKLPFLLANIICLEMILAPVAVAAEPQKSALQYGADLLNFGQQAFGTNIQSSGSNQQIAQMLAQQAIPREDAQFNLAELQKIPGMIQYLNAKGIDPIKLECKTLQTSITLPFGDVCSEEKISEISDVPDYVQAKEATDYMAEFKNIATRYEHYSIGNNEAGQLFGTACMENVMKVILPGFFNYQKEQLKAVMDQIETAKDEFEKLNKGQLDAIKLASLELNGPGSAFSAEFPDSKVFDYGKTLKGEACSAMFTGDKMNEIGKGGGLKAISNQVKDSVESKDNNSRYNAIEYAERANGIEADIRTMAEKVAERSILGYSTIAKSDAGFNSFLAGAKGIFAPTSGVQDALSPSFFTNLQSNYVKKREDLSEKMNRVRATLGARGETAIQELYNVNSDATFDTQTTRIENDIKGECVQTAPIDSAVAGIYDPTLSKEANKQLRKTFGDRIKAIMKDVKLSSETKRAKLANLPLSNGLRVKFASDTSLSTINDGKLDTAKISASESATPVAYFNKIIDHCEAEYTFNKIDNRASAKESIKALRDLKKLYKKDSEDFAKQMKNEIVDKMINCKYDSSVSTTQTSICSPTSFNMQTSGFCAKTAAKCSKNMINCNEMVKSKVELLQTSRKANVKDYNNKVELLRLKLVGLYKTIESQISQSGQHYSTKFGIATANMAIAKEDIDGTKKFDPEFSKNPEDALQVSSPKAYLEKAQDDIKKLSDEVDKQRSLLLASNGILAKHMTDTQTRYDKESAKAEEFASKCSKTVESFKNKVKTENQSLAEAHSELGQNSSKLCSTWNQVMLSDKPNKICDTEWTELANSTLISAQKAGQGQIATDINMMINDMNTRCAGVKGGLEDALQICTSEVPERFKLFFGQQYKTDSGAKDFRGVCDEIQDDKACNAVAVAIPGRSENAVRDSAKKQNMSCGTVTKEKDDDDVTTYSAMCTPITTCSRKEQKIVAIYKSAERDGYLNSSSEASIVPLWCPSNNGSPLIKDEKIRGKTQYRTNTNATGL